MPSPSDCPVTSVSPSGPDWQGNAVYVFSLETQTFVFHSDVAFRTYAVAFSPSWYADTLSCLLPVVAILQFVELSMCPDTFISALLLLKMGPLSLQALPLKAIIIYFIV